MHANPANAAIQPRSTHRERGHTPRSSVRWHAAHAAGGVAGGQGVRRDAKRVHGGARRVLAAAQPAVGVGQRMHGNRGGGVQRLRVGLRRSAPRPREAPRERGRGARSVYGHRVRAAMLGAHAWGRPQVLRLRHASRRRLRVLLRVLLLLLMHSALLCSMRGDAQHERTELLLMVRREPLMCEALGGHVSVEELLHLLLRERYRVPDLRLLQPARGVAGGGPVLHAVACWGGGAQGKRVWRVLHRGLLVRERRKLGPRRCRHCCGVGLGVVGGDCGVRLGLGEVGEAWVLRGMALSELVGGCGGLLCRGGQMVLLAGLAVHGILGLPWRSRKVAGGKG